MKITTLRKHAMIAFGFVLLPLSQPMAFEDIYEPDNSFKQATEIFHLIRQQHTLHDPDDEDWFKFYASKNVEKGYQIKVDNVGDNINVGIEIYDTDGTTSLQKAKRCCDGKEKFLDWKAPADGIYYIRITDMLKTSDDCRMNMQYQVELTNLDLAVNRKIISGFITDKLSGDPIQGAKVRLCEREDETTKTGEYRIETTCPDSTFEVITEAPGYQPLTCHVPMSGVEVGEYPQYTKDIALIPEGKTISIESMVLNPDEKLVSSQTVYRNGDTLRVELPLFPIPEDQCVRYHLGLQYPNGRIVIIKDYNQLEPLNPSALPHWIGTGHNNDAEKTQIVLELPVNSNNLPQGQYQLYLLRISGYVNDVINNLNLGELNATPFEIK
jgi:hypothetical protein